MDDAYKEYKKREPNQFDIPQPLAAPIRQQITIGVECFSPVGFLQKSKKLS